MSILELSVMDPCWSTHVIGTPQPKGSMRSFFAGGRIVLTDQNKQLKPWAATIRTAATGAICHDGPVSVELRFVLPRPPSLTKRVRHPIRKRSGDLDKLCRGVLDALTGLCWVDDSQVIRLTAQKRFPQMQEAPGLTITVWPVDEGA